MPDGHTLLLFLVATAILLLTPGPNMLYVLARGVGQGRRAGVVSALGIGLGSLVHTLAAVAGLSALIVSSSVAYEAVRLAGAGYLVYLGAKALLERPEPPAKLAGAGASLRAIFSQGVVTMVLNPKVALFFLAFLPQFVRPERGGAVWQILLLGLVMNVAGTLFDLGLALAAGRVGDWLAARPGVWRVQQRVTGAAFVLLGLRLAVAGRSGVDPVPAR
jgi:threonine/homoserine/homoserine lactone efflux protein